MNWHVWWQFKQTWSLAHRVGVVGPLRFSWCKTAMGNWTWRSLVTGRWWISYTALRLSYIRGWQRQASIGLIVLDLLRRLTSTLQAQRGFGSSKNLGAVDSSVGGATAPALGRRATNITRATITATEDESKVGCYETQRWRWTRKFWCCKQPWISSTVKSCHCYGTLRYGSHTKSFT